MCDVTMIIEGSGDLREVRYEATLIILTLLLITGGTGDKDDARRSFQANYEAL